MTDARGAAGTPLDDAPELCRLDATALAAGYASGAFSPVEVAEAALARAEAVQARFNAFSRIDAEGALDEARRSAERWRVGRALSAIDGVPTTIKDIVHVRGWPVSFGSATADPAPCTVDAPSVARLRGAGAVLIGQTIMPEFGWKAVTDGPRWGVTVNPWDVTRTPGGSSGGAAVAAAAGAGVLHLGTDGGGSIRIPASFTGIAGIKPTYGRVAAHPPSAFGTVAHIGPMARTVGDVLAMLRVMAGRDLRDWTQPPGEMPALDAGSGGLAGKRVGYWSRPPVGRVEPVVAAVLDAAVARLEDLGARVEPVELPELDVAGLFDAHWLAGAARRVAMVPEELRAAMDPGLLEAAREGARLELFAYMAAQARRAEFGAAMDALLDRHDLLVSPAVAILPFEAGREVPEASGIRRWTEWASFSFPINLSQQPACSVPCGRSAGGLPVGLQIVGPRGGDAAVLAAAAAFEAAGPLSP